MAKQVSSGAEMIDYLVAFFLPPVSSSQTRLLSAAAAHCASVPSENCLDANVGQVGVFLKRGCGADILINILLCILGWLPGVIHAWWIIG